MSEKPKVTVLMSVFNGRRFLRPSLESILNQSYRNFELLIVDDGSTDDTGEIVRSLKDARIQLHRNASNLGLTASLNRGVELARSPLIARMDSDDISHPERLARQVAHLEAHPEVGALGSAYTNTNQSGKPLFTSSFAAPHGFLVWYMFFQNPIAHPSVLMRTDVLRKVGGYRSKFRYGQDLDLWWRMARHAKLGNLDQPLIQLRRHPHSITNLHMAEQRASCALIREEMRPAILGADQHQMIQTRLEAATTLPGFQARYITALWEAYLATAVLTEQESRLVRRDAAYRLGLLALKHPLDASGPATLAQAHRLDPLVLLRIAAWPVHRHLFRRVANSVLRH